MASVGTMEFYCMSPDHIMDVAMRLTTYNEYHDPTTHYTVKQKLDKRIEILSLQLTHPRKPLIIPVNQNSRQITIFYTHHYYICRL